MLPSNVTIATVEGVAVRVAIDPEKQVLLVPLPDAGMGGQELVQLPTAEPPLLLTVNPSPTTSVVLPTVAPVTATPAPRPACIGFTNYTVQAGDTLFSISRRFVTSIALMARHGISSTSLVPGAVIRVPVGDPACCSGGWRPYVVEEGETWFSIARHHSTTTDALLQGNGLSPGATLYMATAICVP